MIPIIALTGTQAISPPFPEAASPSAPSWPQKYRSTNVIAGTEAIEATVGAAMRSIADSGERSRPAGSGWTVVSLMQAPRVGTP